MNRALVVTTINPPNVALRQMAQASAQHNVRFIVVGDTKSPVNFHLIGSEFLDIAAQGAAFPEFAAELPTRHYARKNIGYLLAIRDGAEAIQETDDDNIPRPEFWTPPSDIIQVDRARSENAWLNIYALFTDKKIWPRGFPLECVANGREPSIVSGTTSRGLIVQGLADDNPDVDAVYRLLFPLPIRFNVRKPVLLGQGTWCPFNSQNTTFRSQAFPLLYLPSHCSFRMTDIWRSFIAQRCLWELDEGLVFTSPTVVQERNEHSLLRDLEDEVPGYLRNDVLRRILEDCPLRPGDTMANLVKCYEALCAQSFFKSEELTLVQLWVRQLERF
ncbi:MAG TPA: STELLO glycosyltransferase family protein [Polyangiaceae bacterium]